MMEEMLGAGLKEIFHHKSLAGQNHFDRYPFCSVHFQSEVDVEAARVSHAVSTDQWLQLLVALGLTKLTHLKTRCLAIQMNISAVV